MFPQLTRYLYFKDECFYSLMHLFDRQKSSFDEVIFWSGEIFIVVSTSYYGNIFGRYTMTFMLLSIQNMKKK